MNPQARKSLQAGKSLPANDEGSPAGRAVRFLLTPRRQWSVFAVGSIAQVALFYGVGLLGETSRYLGIPGAAAALFGVAAAVVTGPLVGAGVALVGGAAFIVFVTEFGGFVSLPAIVIAVVLWTLASVLAGVTGQAIRRQSDAREALLSDALAESEASKEAIEGVLTLAPSFHRSATYDGMVKAICEAARETFGSRSAALYRNDSGRIVLLGREPPTPIMTPGSQIDPAEFPGLAQIIESGIPGFVGDLLPEMSSPDAKELTRSLGLRSALRIPIRLTPTSAYLLVIGWGDVQESLDPARLALAQRFADQAAVALEHADAVALHKRLEQSLLSRSRDPHPWLDVHIRYRSGESRLGVGGDFVDYVVHHDKGLSFVIGDVSGHGPDAAALGATLRSGWRALATAGTPPRQALDSLDQVLFSERSSNNMYCTLLAGRVDGLTGSLTLANAGHPPPLLVAKEARLLPVRPVLPLGCERHDGWRLGAFHLPQAWSLLLYTDGLFEGAAEPGSAERYGLDRLVARFNRAAPGPISVGLLDQVLAELEQANGKPPPDDVAVLLISKAA
jgi:serine phosphatase RsbU (regulator of sigma subunit)